jgi:hypothetical protein
MTHATLPNTGNLRVHFDAPARVFGGKKAAQKKRGGKRHPSDFLQS